MSRKPTLALLPLLAMLLTGFVAPSVFATDATAAFDAANKLYDQGKFAEAATAYKKLSESAPVSAAVYFNLGNAFFKSGELGRAVAAYRQAERIEPRDPDLQANLHFVLNQIQGPTLLSDRWQRWLDRLTVNEWTRLVAAAFWLSLLLLALIQLRPALKPKLRGLTLVGGLATIGLGVCLGAVLLANASPKAIVIAREAVVRNGPLDESQTAFTVHDGAELKILDQKDDWLQVTADGRRSGWLKSDQVLRPGLKT